MKISLSEEFGLRDGEIYTIGRAGDIHLDSPMVSKKHVAMKIKNERIYLCDLNSTNGTYLEVGDKLYVFVEGYVSPLQTVVMADVKCTLRGLLEDWVITRLSA